MSKMLSLSRITGGQIGNRAKRSYLAKKWYGSPEDAARTERELKEVHAGTYEVRTPKDQKEFEERELRKHAGMKALVQLRRHLEEAKAEGRPPTDHLCRSSNPYVLALVRDVFGPGYINWSPPPSIVAPPSQERPYIAKPSERPSIASGAATIGEVLQDIGVSAPRPDMRISYFVNIGAAERPIHVHAEVNKQTPLPLGYIAFLTKYGCKQPAYKHTYIGPPLLTYERRDTKLLTYTGSPLLTYEKQDIKLLTYTSPLPRIRPKRRYLTKAKRQRIAARQLYIQIGLRAARAPLLLTYTPKRRVKYRKRTNKKAYTYAMQIMLAIEYRLRLSMLCKPVLLLPKHTPCQPPQTHQVEYRAECLTHLYFAAVKKLLLSSKRVRDPPKTVAISDCSKQTTRYIH
jgi:hypothetical protein